MLSSELQRVLWTFRLVAGVYAATVHLGVWISVLQSTGNVPTLAVVMLPITAAVLVGSAWIRPDMMAWVVSLVAAWLPYLVLVWGTDGSPEPWLPFGLLSSLAGILSAVTARTAVGATLIAVFAALQAWVLLDPPAHLRLAASVIHGVPVLLTYQVAVSIGVLIAYRAADRYVQEADARRRYMDQLSEAETVLERQRAERLRATQRLHETVLNTLRAVGRHADGTAPDIAERCAEDLVVLEDWQYDSRPHTLREIVDTSITTVDLGDVVVDVRPDRNLTLSAETSDAVRSMLTELLTNVSRHARASNVVIGWQVLDDMRLVFTVEDDGIGIADKSSGRLGIRRIVTDTAAGLDGQVLLADRPGGGTVVTLRIRLRAPGIAKPDVRLIIDLPRTILKLMAQAALVWAVLVSPFIVIDLERPLIIGSIGVVAAVVMLLAVTLCDQPPTPAMLTAMLLSGLALLLASRMVDSCVSASSLQWLMNIFVIMLMVSGVFGRAIVRIASAVAAVAFPLLLLPGLLPGCSDYIWLPWISMFTLVAPTVAFAFTRSTDEQQEIDANQLDRILTEQLRRERQADERRLRWAEAMERSRQVMQDIVYTGSIDDLVRQRAEVADAQLRGQLLIEPAEDGALAAFALELIDTAAERGVAVKAEVLNVSKRPDRLPDAAMAQVHEVVALAQGEAQLKLFVVGDEESMTLIVPIVPGCLPVLGDGTPAEGFVEIVHGDLRLEFDPQPVDANGLLPLWVNVARPVRAMAGQ